MNMESVDGADRKKYVSSSEKFRIGLDSAHSVVKMRGKSADAVVVMCLVGIVCIVIILTVAVFKAVSIGNQISAFLGAENRAQMANAFLAERIEVANRNKQMMENLRFSQQYPDVLDRISLQCLVLNGKLNKGVRLDAEDFGSLVTKGIIRTEKSQQNVLYFSIDATRPQVKLAALYLISMVYAGEQTHMSQALIYSSANNMGAVFNDPVSSFVGMTIEDQKELLSRLEARLAEARKDAQGVASSLANDVQRAAAEADARAQRFARDIAPDPFETASKVVLMLTLYTIAGALVRVLLAEIRFRNRLVELQVGYAFAFGLPGKGSEIGTMVGPNAPDNTSSIVEASLDKVLGVLKEFVKK